MLIYTHTLTHTNTLTHALASATSAFNNLGVTFYAPTDFVSFWCVDSEPLALAASSIRNHSTILPYEPSSLSPVAQHGAAHQQAPTLGPNLTQLALAAAAASANQYPAPSSQRLELPAHEGGASRSVGQLLSDFLVNSERSRRHFSPDFNSDTPRNLRKECDYLSPSDNKRHKCTAFRYDTGIWMSTIIDEWNLVCDRSVLISMTQSLYMSGSTLR